MSLASFDASFSASSPGYKNQPPRPYHETVLIQNLPDASTMSKEYQESRKKEEIERNRPPKNHYREEEVQEETILLFPASQSQQIQEDMDHIQQLKAVLMPRLNPPPAPPSPPLELTVQSLSKSLGTTQSSQLLMGTTDSLGSKVKEYQSERPSAISDNGQAGEPSISIPTSPVVTARQVRMQEMPIQEQSRKRKAELPPTEQASEVPMQEYLHGVLQTITVQSRCMKCRCTQVMTNTRLGVAEKSGRLLAIGNCIDCGYTLSRFAPKEVTAAKKSKLGV
jgi:hypothetical protein